MNKELLKSKLSEVSHTPSANSWGIIEKKFQAHSVQNTLMPATKVASGLNTFFVVGAGVVFSVLALVLYKNYYSESEAKVNTPTSEVKNSSDKISKSDVNKAISKSNHSFSENTGGLKGKEDDSEFNKCSNQNMRNLSIKEDSYTKKNKLAPASVAPNIINATEKDFVVDNKVLSGSPDNRMESEYKNEIKEVEKPKHIPKTIKYVTRRDTIIKYDTLISKNKK